MNGYKLLEDAARLIGLETADENLKIIGLPLVNAVITELGYTGIDSLSEKIGISSDKTCHALKFGVASLIANATGDTVASGTMREMYLSMYSKLSSRVERVRDVLPKGEA